MASGQAVILRHGKAERDSPTGRDPDRPLAERGVLQAGWMGRQLADLGLGGAVLLASPAVRTRHTAEIVGETLGIEPVLSGSLFLDAMASDVVALLEEHAGDGGVIVVGHNPTLSMVASLLTRGVGGAGVSLRTGEAAVCGYARGLVPGRCTLDAMLRWDHRSGDSHER